MRHVLHMFILHNMSTATATALATADVGGVYICLTKRPTRRRSSVAHFAIHVIMYIYIYIYILQDVGTNDEDTRDGDHIFLYDNCSQLAFSLTALSLLPVRSSLLLTPSLVFRQIIR